MRAPSVSTHITNQMSPAYPMPRLVCARPQAGVSDTAERFNVRNAFDATQNLRGGMRYLRWLLSYYRGNVSYALAAYNAGEGRVNRHKGIPPFPETRAYVKRVIGLYGGTHHSFDEKLTAGAPWLAGAR